MTKLESQEILKKLERIEYLLVKIVPEKSELNEDEVLEIINEGDKEYKAGRTKVLRSLSELR